MAGMEVLERIPQYWYEFFQSVGIGANLLLAIYVIWRERLARKAANLMAATREYREIWSQTSDQPELFRVKMKDVDLKTHPVTDAERQFLKFLIFQLYAVYETMKLDAFVRMEGLKRDIREFFTFPIPKAVWDEMKPHQNEEFVRFVEESRLESSS